MIHFAQFEICIISPWVNRRVANIIIPMLKEACHRGVKVKIIYGISGDTSNPSEYKRRENSDETIKEYKKELGEALVIKKDNTHVKLCICDDFYLTGSYNFLSFDGNYSGTDLRKEYARYGESKQKVQELKNEYFKRM